MEKDVGDAMYDPRLALVPMPTNAMHASTPEESSSAVACGLGLTSVLAIGLFLGGLPLVAMGIIAVAGTSMLVLETAVTARRARQGMSAALTIPPELIVSLEIRATYRAMVQAYTDLQHALSEAPRLRSSARSVLERCRAAVELCSRVAVLANHLQSYLDTHDPAQARSELERLRARTEITNDDQAIAVLGQAAAARARQLTTHEQLEAMRDRIHARIELVRAALESFSASVVRLHVAGEEQMILVGESVADHLDGVTDELDVLETALATELAS